MKDDGGWTVVDNEVSHIHAAPPLTATGAVSVDDTGTLD